MTVYSLDDLLQNRTILFCIGVEATHQTNQRFGICNFFQSHGCIVVESAACGKQNTATIFHYNRQQTILRSCSIEIINDKQRVLFQCTKKTVVFAEAFFIIVIWQIIRKIYINNILLQISGVDKIKDICIFFVVLFHIGFRQFTFANTGNALEKNFSVVAQQLM